MTQKKSTQQSSTYDVIQFMTTRFLVVVAVASFIFAHFFCGNYHRVCPPSLSHFCGEANQANHPGGRYKTPTEYGVCLAGNMIRYMPAVTVVALYAVFMAWTIAKHVASCIAARRGDNKQQAPKISISVEGNIGSGKTTLCKLLRNNGYIVEEQDIGSWDKIRKKFYKEPKKYALGFQKVVSDSYKAAWNRYFSGPASVVVHNDQTQFAEVEREYLGKIVITKGSESLCGTGDWHYNKNDVVLFEGHCSTYAVFAKALRDDGTLEPWQFHDVKTNHNPLSNGLNYHAVIYIECSAETAKRRIKTRNRSGEDTIPLEYLKSLEEKYEKFLNSNKKSRFITIRVVEEKFRDAEDIAAAVDKVIRSLFKIKA